jgi:CheY-like chemotaxis protein
MSALQILLAEDNLADILLVRQALEEHHVPHELHVVRDGDKALAFVEKMGELDLNLPKVDGPEVLTEFRKHPNCAPTPVVVITSSDAQKDRARMRTILSETLGPGCIPATRRRCASGHPGNKRRSYTPTMSLYCAFS